jgi:hypothetical protein
MHCLVALERIDAALANQAMDHFLASPQRFPMDAVMLKAILALDAEAGGDTQQPEPTSVQRLRQAVLAHLDARIAEPLAPPADWRRPAQVSCTCPHCRELSRFLDSPSEPTWRFKAAQRERTHVEHQVRRDQCDLDLSTERRGSPHTLVCTKNQASYLRRVRQRQQDLAHRERLLER